MIITNGKVWLENDFKDANIVIEDGKIKEITKKKKKGKKFNAKGFLILPGMIDVHVHLREPGLEYKETFKTGTLAASRGGVTSVIDMPNNIPFIANKKRLQEKIKRAKEIYANVGFSAGILDPFEITDMKDLVLCYKIYMCDRFAIKPYDLKKSFEQVSLTGKPLMIHAEDPRIIEDFKARIIEDHSPLSHSKARNVLAEVSAISQCLYLARTYRTKLHITHVTSRFGLELIKWAKGFTDVTLDVTPHHLFLDEDDFRSKGNLLKVNPPIRKKEDQEYLFSNLNMVDMISSDHAPHTWDEKMLDVWEAEPGIPGLETTLHLLLNEVFMGNLEMKELVRLYSLNPAKRFGLYPQRGIIRVGSYADLVLIDPKKEHKIKSSKFESMAKYTPFEGKKVKGEVVCTFVNGEIAYHNGEFYPSGSVLLPKEVE
ncbi:MAG: dihydroorotase family protein [Candidatus Hydrothermarchaeota archaeon]